MVKLIYALSVLLHTLCIVPPLLLALGSIVIGFLTAGFLGLLVGALLGGVGGGLLFVVMSAVSKAILNGIAKSCQQKLPRIQSKA